MYIGTEKNIEINTYKIIDIPLQFTDNYVCVCYLPMKYFSLSICLSVCLSFCHEIRNQLLCKLRLTDIYKPVFKHFRLFGIMLYSYMINSARFAVG